MTSCGTGSAEVVSVPVAGLPARVIVPIGVACPVSTMFTVPVAAAAPMVGTVTVKVTGVPYVDGLGFGTSVTVEGACTSWLNVNVLPRISLVASPP